MRTRSKEQLEQRRSWLREQLNQIGSLRLGSLLFRYRKCGKPRCACADPQHRGHGVWLISKKVSGKTVMSTVPGEQQLPNVRQQLEEGRRFWKLAEEFAQISDELGRRGLTQEVAEARAAAKKGASKSPWKPRSRRRSKDS